MIRIPVTICCEMCDATLSGEWELLRLPIRSQGIDSFGSVLGDAAAFLPSLTRSGDERPGDIIWQFRVPEGSSEGWRYLVPRTFLLACSEACEAAWKAQRIEEDAADEKEAATRRAWVESIHKAAGVDLGHAELPAWFLDLVIAGLGEECKPADWRLMGFGPHGTLETKGFLSSPREGTYWMRHEPTRVRRRIWIYPHPPWVYVGGIMHTEHVSDPEEDD